MTAEPSNPLIPAREVDPKQELPALELEVLERWRERDVFAQSLRSREGAERWVFYEGPPTANGPPGSHHVLSRVFKDIYPRYQTMRGRLRRAQGRLGLPRAAGGDRGRTEARHQPQGGDRGVWDRASSTPQCRESVFAFLEEWNRLTERIGFWLDLDDAYRTLDETYIESVWWALAEIDRRGLLYEGHKVVPYCPRCETTLSSHEVALGYKDVVDPSVYVKLPQCCDGEDKLLVWTTTPWTLPGNVAVAVSPTATYARVHVGDETFVLAEDRVDAVLGESSEILERFSGRSWWTATGPTRARSSHQTDRDGGFPILADDFVTTEDGTGLVHLAPAFGEDDYRVAAARGHLPADEPRTLYNPVRPDGTYDAARARPRRQRVRGPLRQGPAADERADRRPATRAGCCCGRRTTSTPTRTAGAAAPR